MLGFMLVTAFISMWITNTATTAMMTPIMEAVLKQLDKENLPEGEEQVEPSNDNGQSEPNDNREENRSSLGNVSNSVEVEGKELIELSAPIHERGTSERGLVAPLK